MVLCVRVCWFVCESLVCDSDRMDTSICIGRRPNWMGVRSDGRALSMCVSARWAPAERAATIQLKVRAGWRLLTHYYVYIGVFTPATLRSATAGLSWRREMAVHKVTYLIRLLFFLRTITKRPGACVSPCSGCLIYVRMHTKSTNILHILWVSYVVHMMARPERERVRSVGICNTFSTCTMRVCFLWTQQIGFCVRGKCHASEIIRSQPSNGAIVRMCQALWMWMWTCTSTHVVALPYTHVCVYSGKNVRLTKRLATLTTIKWCVDYVAVRTGWMGFLWDVRNEHEMLVLCGCLWIWLTFMFIESYYIHSCSFKHVRVYGVLLKRDIWIVIIVWFLLGICPDDRMRNKS